MERCPGRDAGVCAGGGLSLVAVLVAGVWLPVARARRAFTMLGVVSVMVAWKVACRMGAFHTIWMPNTRPTPRPAGLRRRGCACRATIRPPGRDGRKAPFSGNAGISGRRSPASHQVACHQSSSFSSAAKESAARLVGPLPACHFPSPPSVGARTCQSGCGSWKMIRRRRSGPGPSSRSRGRHDLFQPVQQFPQRHGGHDVAVAGVSFSAMKRVAPSWGWMDHSGWSWMKRSCRTT